MAKKFYLALLIIFFPLFQLLAEESFSSYDTAFEIEEIVITATRTKIEILDAPVHVTVITGEEIEEMGARNIADVLGRQAGITVFDRGPEGALKSASLRGSTSEGVLITIDGVRLNDSRAGSMDLSLIPLHSIEKIEIVRGGTSALYGADAVGGVINIITKKNPDNRLKIKIENGSYIPQNAVKVKEGDVEEAVGADFLDLLDTQKVSIQYSRDIGEIDVVTSGSFTRANNGYVWNDTEYTGKNRRRVNANMLGGDLYAGVSIPYDTGQFDITGLFVYNDKGIPGALSWYSTDASQRDVLANGIFHFRTEEFFSDFLSLDAKASYKYSSLNYADPDETYPIDDSHNTHSIGLDVAQEMLYFDAFSLVYGLNLAYESVDSTKIERHERINGGLFIESPVYLSPQFTIIPVVRYDIYSDFPDSFNFKLSSVYNISSDTSLKASISKSYRAPTLNDLYWPYTPPYMGWSGEGGNPNLKPETGYSAEFGISAIKEHIKFDAYVFARYLEDEIKWFLFTDENVWRPNNLRSTFYPGVEANGSINFLNNFWFNANYTFIYSFVLKGTSQNYTLSDNKRVPYVPVHSITAGIKYRDSKNIAGIDANVLGKHYTDEANTDPANAYFVLNAHYRRMITNNITLLFAVNNLLNANYETLDGYPMPPLFIRTGIEMTF